MKAKVCDCIPGAGKTEAAIAMMKHNPDKRYLFVTPYLDEVQRIKTSCADLNFVEPLDDGLYQSKLKSLHALLERGANIAQSHSLFTFYTEETRQLIRDGGYTLILDEVMNVINRERTSKADIELLFRCGCMELDEDGYYIRWLDPDYNGAFRDLKKKAESRNLFLSDSRLLFWTMPVCNFQAFDEVYVLTYLFRAQLQRYYYEINGMEFEYIGVRQTVNGGYEFAEDGAVPEYAKTLIDRIHIIQDRKLNEVGDELTAFSTDWIRRERKYVTGGEVGGRIKQIKKNIRSALSYKHQVNSKDMIWTTFKEHQAALEIDRYKSRFVSCNIRATNAYRNCHYAAYCANIYFNPDMSNYLKWHGAVLEEDMYALSEMIQWVWRTAARCGEEVWLYIPSTRMRNLLQDWLEALAIGADIATYHAEMQALRDRSSPKRKRKRKSKEAQQR